MNNLPTRKELKERRKTESPIEGLLLRELQLLGLYPIAQFNVGKYRLDLAFPDKMVGIECDGKEYHSTEEQNTMDSERDEWLKKEGWEIIRISGSDIYKSAGEIALCIAGKKDRWQLRKPKDRSLYGMSEKDDDLPELYQEKMEMIRNEQDEDELGGLDIDSFFHIKDKIKERYNKTI